MTSAIRIFVPPGQEDEFAALRRDLESSLAPTNAHESHLCDLALHAAWSLRRCLAVEAAIQEEAADLGLPDAFFDPALSAKLDRVYRYKKMHETSYRHAVKELKDLRKARPADEPKPAASPSPEPSHPAVEPHLSPELEQDRRPPVEDPIPVSPRPPVALFEPASPSAGS